MITIKQISKITGYTEEQITGKDYRGDLKNVRLATLWLLKDLYSIDELSKMFDRKIYGIQYLINNAQCLLDVQDSRIVYLVGLFSQPDIKMLKTALNKAVNSWDRSIPLQMWIFQKGMEYQIKLKR